MRQDNDTLCDKLTEAENNLKALNENLQRMRDLEMTAAGNTDTRQHEHDAVEEKKQLKKDAKELCNINDRLRNKLKELTKYVLIPPCFCRL